MSTYTPLPYSYSPPLAMHCSASQCLRALVYGSPSGDIHHAHPPCTSTMHIYHAHLLRTSTMHIYHAHLPCTSTMHIYHTHLPCTSTMHIYHAHLPCTSTMHIYHPRLPCTSTMHIYHAHLPCTQPHPTCPPIPHCPAAIALLWPCTALLVSACEHWSTAAPVATGRDPIP
jgi:hypothetical protein